MDFLIVLLRRYIVHLLILWQVIFFFLVKNDPFFGDSISTVSRAALHIYDQHLQTIWYLPQNDPGHPTLIPYLLAVLWTLLGQHLWVGHLLTLLFSISTLLLFRRLALLFMNEYNVFIPLLWLSAYSVFLAQQALVLTHLPLCFFFLLSWYAMLKEKKILFIIASVLLMLTHLEAAFLLPALFFGDFYQHLIADKKKLFHFIKEKTLLYLIPFFIISIWLFFHQQKFGWMVIAPNYAEHREIVSLSAFFKSLLLIAWRLIDYGYIFVFVPILVVIIQKRFSLLKKKIGMIILIHSVTLIFFVNLFLSNSIAHRYFLPLAIEWILFSSIIVTQMKRWKWISISIFLALLVGNYIYYPGKNIGDATLAYRHYFSLEQKIKSDFPENTTIYSYAPTSSASIQTHLDSSSGLHLKTLYGLNMDTLRFVMQNCFNGDFSTAELKKLESWYGKSYESGGIWINIYKNPAYGEKPQHWILRQKGKIELWMEKWKRKIKKKTG